MNTKLYSRSIMAMRLLYLIAGVYFLATIDLAHWYYPILGYLFVAMGNGAAAHKYFSHQQYEVNSVGRFFLTCLATVGAYSPISYWIIQHKHHHRHSDKPTDTHTPDKGFLHAMFLWPFKDSTIQQVFGDKSSMFLLAKIKRDTTIMFFSRYFVLINLLFVGLIGLISWEVLCYGYFTGYLLDYLRLGLINSVCHMKFPGSYRNHDTPDHSYNNYLIGLITLGFAWHNNHHADASKLVMRERWWEVDLESVFATILTKVFPVSK